MLLARGSIDGGCTARVAGLNAMPAHVRDEWDALAVGASEPNPFAERWFLAPALKHLRDGRTVRLIEARDGDQRLAGIVPLVLKRGYARLPIACTTNWLHFQCFMGSPLVRAGQEEKFWRALLALLDDSPWPKGFVTLSGLLEDGPLHRALAAVDRRHAVVHRYQRAALLGGGDHESYLDGNIRSKKRKELRRLANRLGELGTVTHRLFSNPATLEQWCDDFLALEASGWKGAHGAALGNTPATRAFFRDMMRGALDAGRLEIERIDLDGHAVAMLITFRTPPGAWQFKIAYDERHARFSPGVMIELDYLKRALGDPEIMWTDSCATADHPMINHLWAERRAIIQVTLPLKGTRRRLTHTAARTVERLAATAKAMTRGRA